MSERLGKAEGFMALAFVSLSILVALKGFERLGDDAFSTCFGSWGLAVFGGGAVAGFRDFFNKPKV